MDAKYVRSATDQKMLDGWYYHAPKDDQPPRYKLINELTAGVAAAIFDHCPPSRERSLAITKLQEARMWANAAIALNE